MLTSKLLISSAVVLCQLNGKSCDVVSDWAVGVLDKIQGMSF